MARHFREQDIDEFRDCFNLYAHNGQISSLDELTVIMRSLRMSPTIAELKKYFKSKDWKISFADFLDIMHSHSKTEKIPDEIRLAFKAADSANKGLIPARELRHVLLNWGERLSAREVDQIFREANLTLNSMVKYDEFVKIVCAPVPDYY
nr:EOG090X0GKM [Triops cancriformis]